MTRLRLSDLPPGARAKVEAQLGKGEGKGKARSRTKKAAPTAHTDVTCTACGTRLTTAASLDRHCDETGHGRYEINLEED